MSNLSLSPVFSKSYFPTKSVGNKGEETISNNGNLLAEIKESYTKSNVLQFLVESPEDFNKNQFTYLVVSCSSYSDKFNFLAEEQKNFFANNTEQRVGCRSPHDQKSSQPDLTRIELLHRNVIEVTKFGGKSKIGHVKFSHKFYLMFCLHQLKKKRKELIDSCYLKMITEQDFIDRVEIENHILSFEKQIKEYKPTKDGKPQARKKRVTKNKKPQKHGAPRV